MSDEESDTSERAIYRWEINLTYPFDSSFTGEATETVEAATREDAIQKAKKNAGMASSDAYPVYKMEDVDD